MFCVLFRGTGSEEPTRLQTQFDRHPVHLISIAKAGPHATNAISRVLYTHCAALLETRLMPFAGPMVRKGPPGKCRCV